MADIGIMSHIVAGYPDEAGALAAGLALARGGATILEVQFPFSDPSADGPVIQTACSLSLAGGFTADAGFAFVERLQRETGLPVYIMSYASMVFTRGVDAFCARAASAGASGLIVPDLVLGADEGLIAACAARGLDYVPVIAPGIPRERLADIQALKPAWIYAALRAGITGGKTTIDSSSASFLAAVRAGGSKVMAGFGISSAEQVEALRGQADIAIVGSHFTAAIGAAAPGGPSAIGASLEAAIRKLIGR